MSAAAPQDRLRAATLQAHRKRIGRVAQHLREQLDEPIDSAAVTKLAGLSLRQLERIFERTVGESPVAYVRRLRLERAAACLRTARATILTISLEAGFESHAAFTRAFRKRFGETPRPIAHWRRQHSSPARGCSCGGRSRAACAGTSSSDHEPALSLELPGTLRGFAQFVAAACFAPDRIKDAITSIGFGLID